MKQYTSHRNVFSSLLLVFCLFLMLGGNCNSEQVKEQESSKVTSRDMKRTQAGKLSHTLGKLGEYKALIIGINKYQDLNIPELTTAEKDARSMAEVLEKQYCFEQEFI